jgi:hypothetical protein
MKTVTLDLPDGAVQRGHLYCDADAHYGLGDVLEVELPTGLTIDVGWDEDQAEEPFRIVVYREYFGDRFIDFRVQKIDQVATEVQRLALKYSVLPLSILSDPA